MNSQPHKSVACITVKPMTVHIGAEIYDVDLTQPLSSAAVTEIRDALLRWKVVFFRDQHLNHDQHIAFARQFGQTTPAHVVFGSLAQHPEIYPVTKGRTAFAARPAAARVWTDWHTDVTAAINPPFGSVLRAVVVPPYGGDTQWTSMVAAYQALSPTMQQFLATLRAVHRFKVAEDGDQAEDYNAMVNRQALMTEHPFVTVHPETGEHALYTNQEFVKNIVGLTQSESDNLLEYLWEHCVRAEFTVRFRWEAGSIAFWDNRSTQHLAVRDVYQTNFEREFYRVTLNGDVPIGVDGRPSSSMSGEPIKIVEASPELA
jgi:alpha-ketoglutarate-dependent taurine dioxygenase